MLQYLCCWDGKRLSELHHKSMHFQYTCSGWMGCRERIFTIRRIMSVTGRRRCNAHGLILLCHGKPIKKWNSYQRAWHSPLNFWNWKKHHLELHAAFRRAYAMSVCTRAIHPASEHGLTELGEGASKMPASPGLGAGWVVCSAAD